MAEHERIDPAPSGPRDPVELPTAPPDGSTPVHDGSALPPDGSVPPPEGPPPVPDGSTPPARARGPFSARVARGRARLQAVPEPVRRVLTRGRRVLGVVVVALAGSAVGAALAPSTPAEVGPLQVQLRVVPSLHPGVVLLLPPAGRVEFATHEAPISIEAAISEVDLDGARRLIGSRTALDQLERSAPDTLRGAVARAAATSGACALGGAVLASLLVYRRRWRRTAEVAGTLVAVLVATTGATAATFDADRMAQPRFTGLLSKAPYIAGQAESMLQRLQNYRAGLAQIVQGVTALYATTGELPNLPGTTAADDVVTLLHVSDIHLNPIAFDLITRLVPQFKVNLVVDTGDITTWGTQTESATLSRVRQVGVPYVFVRGNHDSRLTQAAVAVSPNAVVLDGDVAQVAGLVIAGIGDPVFTPDQPQDAGASPTVPAPASSRPAGTTGRGSSGSAPSGAASAGPAATGPAASGSASPAPTPVSASRSLGAGDRQEAPDPELRAGNRLASIIRTWDAAHPQRPVSIAAMHEPFGVPPLYGTVPLVLAGHFHRRYVETDGATGTRLMIEGSTGGSGVTATGVAAAATGNPTPLEATLIYLARRGPRAGQVLAYDEITVGGLGLAAISLERTVVRPSPSPEPTPTGTVTGTPSGTAAPTTSGRSPAPPVRGVRSVTSGRASDQASPSAAPDYAAEAARRWAGAGRIR